MPETLMALAPWPYILELETGQTKTLPKRFKGKSIKLVAVNENTQPDYWTQENPTHRILSEAVVTLDISGEQADIVHRPYQMPQTAAGLRIYVETTRNWATQCEYAPLQNMQGDVRLSITNTDDPWGPHELVFPIRNFRWRSSTYNNTWAALVPYNKLYYHRGEDFGAIPDKLDVLAVMDGTIETSPLPHGDNASNALALKTDAGLSVRYAHMNIETINPSLVKGMRVSKGQVLAKTGCTWNGKRSQHNDPHLHIGFSFEEIRVSPFPYLTKAYLRDYPQPVLPMAGGYQFACVGEPVQLDATRTIISSQESVSYTWKLSNGTISSKPHSTITYSKPGLYSEELRVTTKDGFEDRDFAQVRVYESHVDRNIDFGWIYHTPVRGIRPNTPVLLWNRLRTKQTVLMDYGDDSPRESIGERAKHVYRKPGLYTVTLRGANESLPPVELKMRVVVEP